MVRRNTITVSGPTQGQIKFPNAVDRETLPGIRVDMAVTGNDRIQARNSGT